jgi:hypothetical protein
MEMEMEMKKLTDQNIDTRFSIKRKGSPCDVQAQR